MQVNKVLKMLETPFSPDEAVEHNKDSLQAETKVGTVPELTKEDVKQERDDKVSLMAYLNKPPVDTIGLCVT